MDSYILRVGRTGRKINQLESYLERLQAENKALRYENNQLKEENNHLQEEIKYIPGRGAIYLEAKKDFES